MYIVQRTVPQAQPQHPTRAVQGAHANRLGPFETGVGKDLLDTPCPVVDLSRLDANIQRMADLVASAGVRLRPHAKTHKLVQVAERQLAAGCSGLTVAKLGEAELFVDHGIDDIFIAYPLWGVRKWERLCDLAQRAEVRVGADSYEIFEGISRAAVARGLSIPVRIEVDTGFGRCGVQSPDAARVLAQQLSKLHGVRLVGVMSFAGQTYAGGADHVRAIATADATALVAVAQDLHEHGFNVPEISVGSTPSASHVAELAGITEIRTGTYVFSDRDQVELGWGTLEDCALTVLATVVSRPMPTRAVIDAGTKTLSSDRAATVDGWGAIRGHPAWTIESFSEEHAVVSLPPGEGPVGTQVEIVPNHCCGTLNMHEWVAVTRDREVVDWWRVEGRGLVR